MFLSIINRTQIRAAPAAARALSSSAVLTDFSRGSFSNEQRERRPYPSGDDRRQRDYREQRNQREFVPRNGEQGGRPRRFTPPHLDQQRPPRTPARAVERPTPPPHMITLADLSPEQIAQHVRNALAFKHVVKSFGPQAARQSLGGRTVALMFSKRSTRTRVASETSVTTLGGNAMFLGSSDIQLGVNESLQDTTRVVGSMVDGIMARVGDHEEIETLAKYSPVPVVNALSVLYHPTQILADLLAMYEAYSEPFVVPEEVLTAGRSHTALRNYIDANVDILASVRGKKIAWVGDTNNITNELLVTCPRLGMTMSVASPKGYDQVDPRVWARVTEAGTEGSITLTNSPAEALVDADIVVTDTWISMGQEEEKAARLSAFAGYQITNAMVESAGAKPDWKFMHCLPRKSEEVDDEVFYGPRSIVFPEAENRKWTIMAVFDALMGRWSQT